MASSEPRTGPLQGRVVLTTGASRESSAAALVEVASEAERAGARVLTIGADVARRADAERLAADALARFGRVDVLINNASALGPTPLPLLLDTPADAFHDVFVTNVEGPFLLTRALIGPMVARGEGLVVNVTSDAGVIGYAGWGAYGVSKAALDQLTRVWAAELEGTGVAIVCVDPGSMNTVMHRAAEPDEDPAQWADPADVAPFFVALAAAPREIVNGQRLEAQQPGALERLLAGARAAGRRSDQHRASEVSL
jgi:NAD(P)-dependent dehydrogenase (short-subunit alcohol dehydrogenase family)